MQNESSVIAEGLKIASSHKYLFFKQEKGYLKSELIYMLLSVGVGYF